MQENADGQSEPGQNETARAGPPLSPRIRGLSGYSSRAHAEAPRITETMLNRSPDLEQNPDKALTHLG